MDIAAILSSVLTAFTKESGRSFFGRAFTLAISAVAFALAIGVAQVASQSEGSIGLVVVAGAGWVLDVLNLHDKSWLEDLSAWLQRAEFTPAAQLAAAIAGVVAFIVAKFTAEAIWILMTLTTVALGGEALIIAIASAIGVALILLAITASNMRNPEREDGSWWHRPGRVAEIGLTTIISIAVLPLIGVLALISGISRGITFGPPAPHIATGAITRAPHGEPS